MEEEVYAVSVLEEIKRFQEDINKVTLENIKFPTWKSRRARQVSTQQKTFQNLPDIVQITEENIIKTQVNKESANAKPCDDILKNKSDNSVIIPGEPEHEENVEDSEKEFVPVLPSVKKLANKFQDKQENNKKRILLTKVFRKFLFYSVGAQYN